MPRTVVGLFDDADTARQVVQELENNGFRREDISVAARDFSGNHDTTMTTGTTTQSTSNAAEAGAGAGAVVGGLAGLLVGIGALTIPGIGPLVAAGWLATTLAGAGVGALAGGLLGALADAGIPEEEANYYAEGVRRGGTLVMVRAPENLEQKAHDVMNRFHPVDVHERSAYWKENNWSRFDPNAKPYTEDMIRQERSHYGLYAGVPDTDSTFRDTTGSSSALQGSDMGPRYENLADYYRRHYSSSYAHSGHPYEYYEPAYRYGYDLRHQPRYSNYRNWNEFESQVRQDWERTHPNSLWDDVREAIRAGWESLTSHV